MRMAGKILFLAPPLILLISTIIGLLAPIGTFAPVAHNDHKIIEATAGTVHVNRYG